jgi:hypothetical protein
MTHPLRIRTVCRDIVELCFAVVNESALLSPFIYVNYYSITGSIAGMVPVLHFDPVLRPTNLIRPVATFGLGGAPIPGRTGFITPLLLSGGPTKRAGWAMTETERSTRPTEMRALCLPVNGLMLWLSSMRALLAQSVMLG